ncbi:MAG: phospholipase D family protein [Pseudomonadota bacterium]|nr:phospholipase D family protein [Pseudomonadota bacterium]
MRTPATLLLALAACCALAPPTAVARGKYGALVDAVASNFDSPPIQVPAAGSIEVAFSPAEGSEQLVIKVVDSAKSELRILAYSFTSVPLVNALLRAKKRGVDVQLVVDERNNVQDDRSGKARAALSALVNAGIAVRTINVYPIHHDKVIVADRETVELGSFNYSYAAARMNSENVLVNWRNPKLAEAYLHHFERNFRQASSYQLQY